MKKLLVTGFVALMSITTLMINGCAKDGATGPIGATGAQGTAGQNGTPGTSGTNGTNGKDGNANVKGFTFLNQGWVKSGTSYEITVSVPAITQPIIDKGAVFTYISYDGGTEWAAVPVTVTSGSTVSVLPTYKLNSLTITGLGYTSQPNPLSIKVVVEEASNLIAHPNVDFRNYQQVKSTFNL